jgi:uncharacterized membrane protein YkoI
MKKQMILLLLLALVLTFCSSCSLPIVGDFFENDKSLGKTNNTATTISKAMNDYLAKKNKEDFALHGVELTLNSDSNGLVKLYYSAESADVAEYSDIYVAEINSKTGYVERFEKAVYSEDGIEPYQLVKTTEAFDGASVPIDSGKAMSYGVRAFSGELEFYYDYIQMMLSAPNGVEQYSVRFISMLNDKIYNCTVDAVSGTVLASSVEPLK